MRYLIIAIALAVLAGCATAATSDKPSAFYDRKYNTYHELRGDQGGVPRTKPVYDRKYNLHLPVRSIAGTTS